MPHGEQVEDPKGRNEDSSFKNESESISQRIRENTVASYCRMQSPDQAERKLLDSLEKQMTDFTGSSSMNHESQNHSQSKQFRVQREQMLSEDIQNLVKSNLKESKKLD